MPGRTLFLKDAPVAVATISPLWSSSVNALLGRPVETESSERDTELLLRVVEHEQAVARKRSAVGLDLVEARLQPHDPVLAVGLVARPLLEGAVEQRDPS